MSFPFRLFLNSSWIPIWKEHPVEHLIISSTHVHILVQVLLEKELPIELRIPAKSVAEKTGLPFLIGVLEVLMRALLGENVLFNVLMLIEL